MPYYFPQDPDSFRVAAVLELRAQMAWEMLRTNGVLMASPAGEDSAGRQTAKAMPPKELAERAIAIAEEFVALCEAKAYIVLPNYTAESAAEKAGELDAIRQEARYRHT